MKVVTVLITGIMSAISVFAFFICARAFYRRLRYRFEDTEQWRGGRSSTNSSYPFDVPISVAHTVVSQQNPIYTSPQPIHPQPSRHLAPPQTHMNDERGHWIV